MSLFITSGGKSVKFPTPGASITGTVTRPPREQQQTKFGTTEPDYWPNGDPKLSIVVDLDTPERDPQDANDDGARTLYVSSSKMKRAIGDAILKAGASDIEVGGTLTVQYTGNDPASKNPANPAKLYAAAYQPPSSPLAPPQQATAPAPQPVAQAPQQAATPVSQQQGDKWNPTTPPGAAQATAQAAQPAPTGGVPAETAQKVAQLRAMGTLNETQIAAALGITQDQLDSVPF